VLFWCCFAQAWDGGSPVFFLQRSGWSAVGEPLQKTPGTVAGKHRETVAKKTKNHRKQHRHKSEKLNCLEIHWLNSRKKPQH